MNQLMAGGSVNGVSLALGDRVLLTAQTNPVENGIYVVGAAGGLVRAADMPAGSRVAASVVTHARTGDKYICCNTVGLDAVGQDAMQWAILVFDVPSLRRTMGTVVRAPADVCLTTTTDTAVSVPVNLDGVAVTAGMRVLLTQQSQPTENGLWVVGADTAWKRADDMPIGSHAAGAMVNVLGGTKQGETYNCRTAFGADVVGSHALAFVRVYMALEDIQDIVDQDYVRGFVQKPYVDSLNINATQLNGRINQQLRMMRASDSVNYRGYVYLNSIPFVQIAVLFEQPSGF